MSIRVVPGRSDSGDLEVYREQGTLNTSSLKKQSIMPRFNATIHYSTSLFIIAFCLLLNTAFAGKVTFNNYKQKANVSAGTIIKIYDISVLEEQLVPNNYAATRTPKVHLWYSRQLLTDVDHVNHYWTYTINYKIYPSQNPSAFETGSLTIRHGDTDPIYRSLMEHPTIDDAEVTLEITSVTAIDDVNGAVTTPSTSTDIPNDIYIELLLEKESYAYLENETNPDLPFIKFEYDESNSNTLALVSWGYVEGAEAYDLEYVFVDEKDNGLGTPSTDDEPFTYKEPTRIRTPWNHFNLEMTYPKGDLYFRVRPIGRHMSSTVNGDYTHLKNGEWSYKALNGGNSKFAVLFQHSFGDGQNWQYISSFAEEGKQKGVVSFLDGSLRGRQSLTRLNTEDVTMVGESKYDSEGRPVVNILPASRMGTALNSLDFIANFNQNGSGNSFEKGDFENQAYGTIANTGGAGQYYSSANNLAYTHNDYIPDAGGYPYAQVEYMRDNTGRIKQQGAPGSTHKLGNDHTTRFFYGTPTDTELHRMFGENVGNAAHYKKIMTVDPNGQVSMNYTDQEGRTIATCLAGETPDNLLALPTNTSQTIRESLSANNVINEREGTITSINHLTNAVENAAWSFTYDMQGIIYTFTNTINNDDFCTDCAYNLEITIEDPDGIPVEFAVDGGSLITEYNYHIENPNTANCTTNVYDITALSIVPKNGVFTKIGTYTVTKVLSVDTSGLEAEIQAAITDATLGASYLTTLITNAQNSIDYNACNETCDELCTEKAYDFYAPSIPTQAQIDAYVTTCKATECETEKTNAVTGSQADICAGIYEKLLEDVSPGGFHYLESTTGPFWTDVMSNVTFRDVNGVAMNPQPTLATVSTPSTWEEQWAEDMVTEHREYCLYDNICVDDYNRSFNGELGLIANWSDAVASGHIDPLGLQGGTTPPGFPTGVANSNDDPFLTNNTAGATELKALMEDYNGTGKSLWKIIDDIPSQDWQSGQNDPSIDEQMWFVFRGTYIALKEQVLTRQMQDAGCDGYYDDDNSIFTEPSLLFGHDQVYGAINDHHQDVEPDCQDICSLKADIWLSLLPTNCTTTALTSAEEATLRTILYDECVDECGTDNPLGYLDQTAIDDILSDLNTNHNAIYLKVQNCLSSLAETDPYDGGSTCTTINQHVVLDEVYDLIEYFNNELFQVSTVQNTDHTITDNAYSHLHTPYPEMFRFDISADELKYQYDGTSFCSFAGFYLTNGNLVDPSSIFSIYDVKAQGTSGVTSPPSLPWIYMNVQCTLYYYNGTNFVDEIAYIYRNNPNYESGDNCPDLTELVNITLCYPDGYNETVTPSEILPCDEWLEAEAEADARREYSRKISQFRTEFIENYRANCLPDGDVFYADRTAQEYHYTLYYYDQAGNLTQTVPPEGVDLLDPSGTAFNSDGSYDWVTPENPAHRLKTIYAYNSLNHPIDQTTPDAGDARFWYNNKGQLMLSQNAEQDANPVVDGGTTYLRYSYTIYDDQERISEVGELYVPDQYDLDNYSEAVVHDILNQASFPESAQGVSGTIWQYHQKHMVTNTYYDEPLTTAINTEFGSEGQQHLRSRVATSTYEDFDDNLDYTYDHGTHYSYDAHGNVHTLLQENVALANIGQDMKRMEYDYDLISGNVHEVRYQPGEADAFYHRYCYDADNRITEMMTSDDARIWERDAKYFYYLHGPLARAEIGHDKVQGMDYAYTIQGWLKGVNAGRLYTSADIGRDGNAFPHRYIGQDAFGFTLNYFDGDYDPIATTNAFETDRTGNTELSDTDHDLYNGNISRMATALMDVAESPIDVVINQYKYDQLNRIRWSHSHRKTHAAMSTDTWVGATSDGAWNTAFTYDANGNLETLLRNGEPLNLNMDNFTYRYEESSGEIVNNKLLLVNDAITSTYQTDIDDQEAAIGLTFDQSNDQTHNYLYDEIGNLVTDRTEGIGSIAWNVYGKIRSIVRDNSSSDADLEFTYDATGNRIGKRVKPRTAPSLQDNDQWNETWYVRDAQGNIMATYERTWTDEGYEENGASATGSLTIQPNPNEEQGSSGNIAFVAVNGVVLMNTTVAWNTNAATTASDLATAINNYVSSPDYTASASGAVVTITENSGLGAWVNGFPITYGLAPGTNFTITGVTSISGGLTQGQSYATQFKLGEHHLYGSSRVGLKQQGKIIYEDLFTADIDNNSKAFTNITTLAGASETAATAPYLRTPGWKQFEMVNHLGNVLETVSDRKLGVDDGNGNVDYYTANVLSYSDYYPFGGEMPMRNGGNDYHYGFNGMEKDDEAKGTGNSYDFGLRHYDPRLGKMLSIDPRTSEYPWQSPYVYHRNNPINYIDYIGGGDPPKTIRNEDGQVVTPNGYGADFANDWYAAVEGNLVMTNGTDYQVWNPETGQYDIGRAPRAYEGTPNTPYDKYPTDLQLGDTYEQYLYDPYGIHEYTGIFGDSRDLQYLGGNDWLLLDDFSSKKSAEAATWVFPLGGSVKGASTLIKWIGRFNTGRRVITVAKATVKVTEKAFKPFTKSNYRYNLQVLTGKSGVGMDAHHIFPQAKRFQAQWERVGININDPHNMTWWLSSPHRKAAYAYNKAWDSFFKQFPNATRQQIESFGNSLMKSHGF